MAQIPEILLVPGQYQEIDNSLAGSAGEIKKALIVGCKTEAGTAPAGIPVRALSESGAAALCGAGSDAHLMARAFLKLNNVEECWILPLAPPDAGTKWSQTFAVSGAAVADGSVSIAVCGTALEAAVSISEAAATARRRLPPLLPRKSTARRACLWKRRWKAIRPCASHRL
jgi:phage tail sheath gpL-like